MPTKIKVIASTIFIVVALGMAGTSDYDEQVILHMPQETYDEISEDLERQTGSEPSDHEIVVEYKNRHNL